MALYASCRHSLPSGSPLEEVRLDGWAYDEEDNATNYYYFDKGVRNNGRATFLRDTDRGDEDGSVEDVREDSL